MNKKIFLAIPLLLIIAFGYKYVNYYSQSAPVIENFISTYNDQNFEKLALMFRNENPNVKTDNQIPIKDLENFLKNMYGLFGKAKETSFNGFEIAVDTERGKEWVVYQSIRFQKGDGSIDFIFSIVDSKLFFRIVGFGGEPMRKFMENQQANK
ncbi:hypothetical protein V4D05_19070 [Vibrio mimicus]|uniref:hypothetical protein n=1 Tax=Vibrio mimicus TaxID=674 RepID=UPI002F923EE4